MVWWTVKCRIIKYLLIPEYERTVTECKSNNNVWIGIFFIFKYKRKFITFKFTSIKSYDETQFSSSFKGKMYNMNSKMHIVPLKRLLKKQWVVIS